MSHLSDFALWEKKKKMADRLAKEQRQIQRTLLLAHIQQFGLINKINSDLADFKPEGGLTGLYNGFTTAQFILV